MATQLKDANVGHEIYLYGSNIGDAGAIGMATQLKDANVGHEIYLYESNIGDAGAIGIATQLKDANVGQHFYLGKSNIGDAGAIGIAMQLKDANVGQHFYLDESNIRDSGVIGMAEHLKDAKVSHIINLEGVKIGDAGTEALNSILMTAKNPPLIEGACEIGVTQNYALDAFHDPEYFLYVILNRIPGMHLDFKLLPILGLSIKLHQKLPNLVLQKISEYVGIEWMAMHNLATIREVGCAFINRYEAVDYKLLASSKAIIDLGVGGKWHGKNLERYFALSDDLSYKDYMGSTELVRSIYRKENIPDEIFQKAAAKFGSANLLEYIMAVNTAGQGAMSEQLQKFTNIIQNYLIPKLKEVEKITNEVRQDLAERDEEGEAKRQKINGEGEGGLREEDVIQELEKISKNYDGNIDSKIKEAKAKIEELNKTGKYVYIIDPQGEEAAFKEEVELLKRGNVETIYSGMQRDDSTCCDHSLILLDSTARKLKDKYEEAGIVTVEKDDKVHALLYVATEGKSDVVEKVIKGGIKEYKNTWLEQYKVAEMGGLAILQYGGKESVSNIKVNTGEGAQYSILTRLNEYVEHWLQKLALVSRKAEMQKLVNKYGVGIKVIDGESLQSAFKEIVKKTHPDRNVNNVGESESLVADFIKVTELVNRQDSNKIASGICNPIMEKLMGINVVLRVADIATDTVRGVIEGTEESVMKASIGYVQLAVMYQGQYGIIPLLTCKDAVYQAYQGEYEGAVNTAAIGIGLPLIAVAVYAKAPVIGTVMSIGFTLHGVYGVLNNMYDLGCKMGNSIYDLCYHNANSEKGTEGATGIAAHLKDAKVSHKIDLNLHKIEVKEEVQLEQNNVYKNTVYYEIDYNMTEEVDLNLKITSPTLCLNF